MDFVYIYRKYVPIFIRYMISQARKSSTEKRLMKEINGGRFKDEYPNEWEYLIQNKAIVTFPYAFHDKYKNMAVEVYKDTTCNMCYVIHDGKRLYFPQGWAKPFIKKYYLSLLEEQDMCSPHRYFPDDDSFLDEACFFDVGAAEGIISLSIIDRIQKAVLFEADPMWIKALNKTFEKYKEKIIIISKFCSDKVSKTETTLDEAYDTTIKCCFGDIANTKVVVKADVEGMEMKVLAGASRLLQSAEASFLICLYHHPEDDKGKSKNYLQEFKRPSDKLEKSEGYILYGVDDGSPSFRRGLIRLLR